MKHSCSFRRPTGLVHSLPKLRRFRFTRRDLRFEIHRRRYQRVYEKPDNLVHQFRMRSENLGSVPAVFESQKTSCADYPKVSLVHCITCRVTGLYSSSAAAAVKIGIAGRSAMNEIPASIRVAGQQNQGLDVRMMLGQCDCVGRPRNFRHRTAIRFLSTPGCAIRKSYADLEVSGPFLKQLPIDRGARRLQTAALRSLQNRGCRW